MSTRKEGEIIEGANVCDKNLRARDRDYDDEELSFGVILFLESLTHVNSEYMFGARIRSSRSRGNNLPVVSRLEFGDHDKYLGGGYAAVGSRVYKIGGDIQWTNKKVYPKDIWYCNIEEEEEEGVLCCGIWEEGPSLSGGKPSPLLVTVNQKIYALAGHFISPYTKPGTEDLSTLFEVLDPFEGNRWETLADPPFKLLYSDMGARILSHTVIGNTIYMRVVGADATSTFYADPELHWFDTVSKVWDSPPLSIPVADNLRLCYWSSSADVVDNLMYLCVLERWESGTKVFAYDLAAVKKDKMIVVDEEEEHDGGSEPYHEHVVVVPVHGLTHVTDSLPFRYSGGFVTHLGRNTFCLVATYNLHRKNWIRVCTFDVVEEEESSSRVRRAFCARNVEYVDYHIGDLVRVQHRYAWCKIRV